MNKGKWIQAAQDGGFESFEIYEALSKERSLRWFAGEMETFVTSRVTGYALRGIYQGKLVSYATENPDDGQMERILSVMKEQAAAITSEDESFILQPQETECVKSTHQFISPDAGKVKEALAYVEKQLLAFDPRMVQVTHLEWSEEDYYRLITNSFGMHAEDAGRVQVLVAGAAAVSGEEVRDDFLVRTVQDLSDFDLDAFVKKLGDTVIAKFGAAPVASGTYPVILEKDAMTSLFAALSGMFSGEKIGKGLSPLRDKIDTQIFSELVTVIDDPRNTDYVNLMNYDDEGCPTREKTVVERGTFHTILHSAKSAARMGTVSTGNGFKASYASAVDVRPQGCYIVPGTKSLEELEKEMGDGHVITDLAGLHAGIDHVTTDFSLQCSGYLVKNGVRDRSVTLITIAANFLELMKQVRAVGNDLDWNYRNIAAPSILFEGIAVSGE